MLAILCMLARPLSISLSYLLKSPPFWGWMAPPSMFSFATEVKAVAFGARGQDPYQLCDLRTSNLSKVPLSQIFQMQYLFGKLLETVAS